MPDNSPALKRRDAYRNRNFVPLGTIEIIRAEFGYVSAVPTGTGAVGG
ncbi:MAG: hypothetical protein WBQ08_15945 [Candidatus Sulfotelmatobacter sp.]